MSGTIPQSSALAEASADSLAELMSRDPEGYSRQDRERLVQVLRAQRERWQAAEAIAVAEGRSRARTSKATSSAASIGDLGI